MPTYGLATSAANTALPTGTSYVQLHVGDPGSAGTANVSAGSTTRQSVTWGTPSGGVVSITAPTSAWTNGGTTETLTAVSWWTAPTGGTFQGDGLLSSSQSWASGNTYALTSLTVTIPTAS